MQAQGSAKKFSAWQAPVQAFFNRQFYVDVVENWTGTGSLYMLLACLVAAFFSVLPLAVPMIGASNDPQLATFLEQLPKVTFADGQVSIDKPTPYQIKDPKTGVVIAEFRTNEKGDPKLAADGPPIVITRDAMAIAESKDAEPKTYEFAQLTSVAQNFAFDGNDALRCTKMILLTVPIGAFVLGIPMLFIGHLVQMLIYGGIAMAIFSNMECPIVYSTGMRLAAIAMTPAIIISSLLKLISLLAPRVALVDLLWMFGSVALVIVYIALAASTTKDARRAR